MTTRTQLRIGTNTAGCKFAITRESDNTHTVWRQCANYSRTARDGIALTWRYVQRDMTIDEATTLLEFKLAGKQKP